jgi:hypothetical protein
MSSADASGTSVITSSVAGFSTSITRSDVESTYSPPMKSFSGISSSQMS